MKKVVFFLFSLCIGSVRADFFPNTEDIPVMEGIILTETTDFEFDTPMGQILTFEAKTDYSSQQIRSFYSETLKSLGWHLETKDVYVRGNDRFSIYFPSQNQVRFEMTLVGSEF
jgi:hypothetical protein